jgi:pimeloyl-ACP methyl ester carboxylesterase
MLQISRKPGAFSPPEIEHYRRAWWQKNAMTSMLNWYRAVFRSALREPWNPQRIQPRRVTPSTLILWGENDMALCKEMAQLSLDLCDQGELVTFPHATHWVQHDEAEEVTRRLVKFLA